MQSEKENLDNSSDSQAVPQRQISRSQIKNFKISSSTSVIPKNKFSQKIKDKNFSTECYEKPQLFPSTKNLSPTKLKSTKKVTFERNIIEVPNELPKENGNKIQESPIAQTTQKKQEVYKKGEREEGCACKIF